MSDFEQTWAEDRVAQINKNLVKLTSMSVK